MWKVVEASAGNLGTDPPTGSNGKSSIHKPRCKGRTTLEQQESKVQSPFFPKKASKVTFATDLNAGSGAPWAGHWRLTGVILREAMVCATNPESFGLAPPTGSEEEKYEEAHILVLGSVLLTQCPRL